jgi:anti-sigma factor RsiW
MTRGETKKQIPSPTRINQKGECQTLGRPFGKHVDNQELNALVPSRSEAGRELRGISANVLREAQLHVQACAECGRKVWKYWLLLNRTSIVSPEMAPPGVDCPKEDDVNWYEIAAGLWPESKATQLISHAATCGHCGPLLRAATRMEYFPTPQKELMLAGLRVPSPIASSPSEGRAWLSGKWLAPVMALILMTGVWLTRSLLSARPLSGQEIAEFAVATHRQHAQGALPLDVRTDSQQALNAWFNARLQYALSLPASAPAPGEQRPYRLEGARLVRLGNKTSAYIAYQTSETATSFTPVSLVVAPATVGVATGGIEVHFTKVTFHYSRLDGYKVVTWTTHGLTYALVSNEDNGTQRSCMVCHSAMRDREMTHIFIPQLLARNPAEPAWQ